MSLNKTDRILTESSLRTLSCFLCRKMRSLMNALEAECFCLREISINVNKFLVVLLFYIFISFFILHFVVGFLLLNHHFFVLMLLLHICFFINHVNKSIIFVFVAFVYHFKNTISIFVRILCEFSNKTELKLCDECIFIYYRVRHLTFFELVFISGMVILT